ncbi:unnamed protein product [Moneuplotes crassus]|uniref:Uncharacterized protein n=1 Tax=Euplotes crassus TaxID=5936 RepID=A0AAD1XSR0_EUPCR|nr:unnamed protein product [Moneuplotes crassus]
MLLNLQKKEIKLSECVPTFMISKKGKTTNVQFAAFRRNFNNKRLNEFNSTNPAELTFSKKPIMKKRNSASFLATGREGKANIVKGSIGSTISEGVEVGRYTPRYPRRRDPTYTFSKVQRDTKLFLFADHTWIRDCQNRYRNLKQQSLASITRLSMKGRRNMMKNSFNTTRTSFRSQRPTTAKSRRSSRPLRPGTAKVIKVKRRRVKKYRNSSL